MSYEGIRIPEELNRSVQEAVGVPPQSHGTLDELVGAIATERGAPRAEDLVSENRPATRSRRTERRSTPTASSTP